MSNAGKIKLLKISFKVSNWDKKQKERLSQKAIPQRLLTEFKCHFNKNVSVKSTDEINRRFLLNFDLKSIYLYVQFKRKYGCAFMKVNIKFLELDINKSSKHIKSLRCKVNTLYLNLTQYNLTWQNSFSSKSNYSNNGKFLVAIKRTKLLLNFKLQQSKPVTTMLLIYS